MLSSSSAQEVEFFLKLFNIKWHFLRKNTADVQGETEFKITVKYMKVVPRLNSVLAWKAPFDCVVQGHAGQWGVMGISLLSAKLQIWLIVHVLRLVVLSICLKELGMFFPLQGIQWDFIETSFLIFLSCHFLNNSKYVHMYLWGTERVRHKRHGAN